MGKPLNTMKTKSLIRFRWAAPALAAVCALFSCAVAQAQPTITSTYPDGTVQFQFTNSLAIAISSTAGVSSTNISVQFTTTNLSDVYGVTNLTVTNGLTVTGPPTSLLVTAPLTSNLSYTAVIIVADSTGILTNTLSFDTVIPSYTWEAEDFDYTITNSDGTVLSGQFFDNPQTNAYAGLAGLLNVDAYNPNNGGAAYRPTPPPAPAAFWETKLPATCRAPNTSMRGFLITIRDGTMGAAASGEIIPGTIRLANGISLCGPRGLARHRKAVS